MTMIDTAKAANAAATTATGTAKDATVGLGQNFASFLKLLTTQLQNQDPLQPLDTKDFTNQLVSFSQVEQAIDTNKNLESLLALMQSRVSTDSVGYLGKQVEIDGAEVTSDGGPVTWRYRLAGDAAAVKVTVVDAAGTIVKTLAGKTSAGVQEVAWDGTDGTGRAVPAGTYSLKVVAADGSGQAVAATVSRLGLVTGIEYADDEAQLIVGGSAVPLSRLKGLYLPG